MPTKECSAQGRPPQPAPPGRCSAMVASGWEAGPQPQWPLTSLLARFPASLSPWPAATSAPHPGPQQRGTCPFPWLRGALSRCSWLLLRSPFGAVKAASCSNGQRSCCGLRCRPSLPGPPAICRAPEEPSSKAAPPLNTSFLSRCGVSGVQAPPHVQALQGKIC